jgi:hypothetical protein
MESFHCIALISANGNINLSTFHGTLNWFIQIYYISNIGSSYLFIKQFITFRMTRKSGNQIENVFGFITNTLLISKYKIYKFMLSAYSSPFAMKRYQKFHSQADTSQYSICRIAVNEPP